MLRAKHLWNVFHYNEIRTEGYCDSSKGLKQPVSAVVPTVLLSVRAEPLARCASDQKKWIARRESPMTYRFLKLPGFEKLSNIVGERLDSYHTGERCVGVQINVYAPADIELYVARRRRGEAIRHSTAPRKKVHDLHTSLPASGSHSSMGTVPSLLHRRRHSSLFRKVRKLPASLARSRV